MQCVEQTGFNMFAHFTPVQLDPSAKGLCDIWVHELTVSDKRHVLHFAHSQGVIITRAALQRFHRLHSDLLHSGRFHLIVFGSGSPYWRLKWAPKVFPNDRHWVGNKTDLVAQIFGGGWLTLKKPYQSISDIVNFPDKPKSSVMSSHSWWFPNNPGDIGKPGEKANTYSWWTYYVGGPCFRLSTQNSIHGEKWWAASWNDVKVTVETDKSGNDWADDTTKDEWVKVTRKDTNQLGRFNPRQTLRDRGFPTP